MATQHEAVLGGARWRLTLHPDGRWDVTNTRSGAFSGNGGLLGMREAAGLLRSIATDEDNASASSLESLADVAERSTTP